MERAAYIIVILCGILSQGICHVFPENNEKSSEPHIRQKRLAGGAPHSVQQSPYMVNILQNGEGHCPATLLTSNVVITSATCFASHQTGNMRIMSRKSVGTTLHVIVSVVFLNQNFNPTHPTINNLVLAWFFPAIDFRSSPNRPIHIYGGNLARDQYLSLVINWGRPLHVSGKKIPSTHLRALSVNVISIEYCHQMYPRTINVGNICTRSEMAGEHCENDDTGSPLIHNNQLLGIFVYHGLHRPTHPDVFMNLLDHDIRRWIHQHVPSLRLF